MAKRNLTKLIGLIVFLVSLIVFILAETKAIDIVYPWHTAIMVAIGVIGLLVLIKSLILKKIMGLALAFLLIVGFSVYFVFAVLHLDILLGLGISVVVGVIIFILRYAFNVPSDFVGDNKVEGYKHYTERRKEQNDTKND